MSMRILSALAIGMIFGLGIAISGMANPAKVLNFFDIAGTWDPSLVFVMAAALIVTAIGYRIVFPSSPRSKAFFDEATNTISYVVKDPASNACAVIDSGDGHRLRRRPHHLRPRRRDHQAYIEDNGLKLEWLIETHVHADHLSAAPYIQEKLGGKIGIGEQDHHRAGHLRQDLQRRHRIPARRLAVRRLFRMATPTRSAT
jgi:glyoxylase-like metal-dependent hydrolase (beta-lactamase superfamily II)